MIRPVRLRLSRAKGFDLQALSKSYNGRDAVVVTRPGQWGNPFIVNPRVAPGTRSGVHFSMPTVEDAVACYKEMMTCEEGRARLEAARKELAGKNLACWCGIGEPCHADILLELVNAPGCEAA